MVHKELPTWVGCDLNKVKSSEHSKDQDELVAYLVTRWNKEPPQYGLLYIV